MTDYAAIEQQILRLEHRFGTRDPFALAKERGIEVMLRPMGKSPADCKGFFLSYCRIPMIVINSDLSDQMQRIICAHELGHAVLHPEGMQTRGYHDVFRFNAVDDKEKEANLFAAELLLSDERVLEALGRDTTFFEAASALNVPAELLDFKFRVLKWKGYRLIEPPTDARSDFMRKWPAEQVT